MHTLVLACGHCGVPSSVAGGRLGRDSSVVRRRSLCADPGLGQLGLDPADLAVIVLMSGDLDRQAALEDELTHAGVHPLRIRFLDSWRAFRDPGSIGVHVRAAAARLREAEPIELAPLRATIRFRGHVTRRSLLVPLARLRAPVPRVDPTACRSSSGCDLCVGACPERAIARGDPPRIDGSICTSCGVCLSACPVGAMGHPSLSPRTIESEVEALADDLHLNLLVVCTAAMLDPRLKDLRLDARRWRILEIPTAGALRASSILRFLAKGFDRIVGLGADGCCPGAPGPFATASALLEAAGRPGCVDCWDLSGGPFPAERFELPPFAEHPLPAAGTIQGFAAGLAGREPLRVALPGPGAALVELDADRCTLCNLCTERCWSGALERGEPGQDRVRLTFAHEACDGCGLCAAVCPERALSVRYAIDTAGFGVRTTLKEDRWVSCARCGVRVAPRSMVARVASKTKVSRDLDLCPDCKSVRIFESARASIARR